MVTGVGLARLPRTARWVAPLRALSILLVGAMMLCQSRQLCAQPDNILASEQAIRTGRAALAAYQAGDFQVAYEGFKMADALAHSPVFVLHMGRALVQLGRLLDGRELLRQLKAEPLESSAPAVFYEAVRSAQAECTLLDQWIPTVTVSVKGTPLELRIDDKRVESNSVGQPLELDPGRHTFEASDAQGRRASRTLTLGQGQRLSVELVFDVSPRVMRAVHNGAAQPPTLRLGASQQDRSRAPSTSSRRLAGWTALGMGAGALAIATVSGIIAITKSREIKERCTGNQCSAADQERGESALLLANISTIGFVVGGISVGVGGSLVLAGESRQPAPGAKQDSGKSRQLALSLAGAF